MFGADYPDMDLIKGRTFYGRSCTPFNQSYEDVDKTSPPNYCLGGRDFLKTSWCEGVRQENQPYPFESESLVEMFLMKQDQGKKYCRLPQAQCA
jgi:hypothetical protein